MEFWPKNDKDEKKRLANKIIIIKLPVKIAHPNKSGIEKINVPAKLDLTDFMRPYLL